MDAIKDGLVLMVDEEKLRTRAFMVLLNIEYVCVFHDAPWSLKMRF